jgi:nitrogen fixation protein NifU and related proteins
MAYSEKVIDHYNNPRNMGSLPKDDKQVGTGIVGAKFKTFGCGSAIASSSLATEWLKGRTVDEAYKIKNTDIVQELNLPPVKIHCSVLAEDAIKSALEDYKKKASTGAPQAENAAVKATK